MNPLNVSAVNSRFVEYSAFIIAVYCFERFGILLFYDASLCSKHKHKVSFTLHFHFPSTSLTVFKMKIQQQGFETSGEEISVRF